eukprot:UN11367
MRAVHHFLFLVLDIWQHLVFFHFSARTPLPPTISDKTPLYNLPLVLHACTAMCYSFSMAIAVTAIGAGDSVAND